MRLLFVSSEVFPLIKTGGLADVSGALPPALRGLGVDARLLMPAYPQAVAAAGEATAAADLGDPFSSGPARLLEARLADGTPVWLVDCPALYDRPGGPYQDAHGNDWPDNDLRFGLLGWAAARLCRDDGPTGWRPDVLHLNDWQSGLAAAYLTAWGGPRPPIVATIHNMAYQGLFPPETVPRLGLPWTLYGVDGMEFWGRMSFLKAALAFADRLTTVSPTYAREIQSAPQGCGLEGLLAARSHDLVGILNGADYAVWNPATDPHLAHRYDPADLDAKVVNKAALQAEMGLPGKPEAPLFVVVSRLNEHKGMDLVLGVLPHLLTQGAQLAVLGSGDRDLEDAFRAVSRQHPDQVAAFIGFNEGLAHRLIAGGDILLMPSRSEPCGLTQMYALRYGTVPLVHRVGGLADTVVESTYDTMVNGTATGFVFAHPDVAGLQWSADRALALYRQPEQWRKIRAHGPRQDFSWRRAAERYRDLYASLIPT